MKMEQVPQNTNIENKRKAFVEKGNYVPVNKVLSYGIDGRDLHIHFAPAADLGLAEKMRLVREGFKDLAIAVQNNTDIEEVSATSWIVAKNPELLKKMGFMIDNSTETILRLSAKRIYQLRSRPLARAVMSRQEFLKKYLEN
jgi:hypothetical protein